MENQYQVKVSMINAYLVSTSISWRTPVIHDTVPVVRIQAISSTTCVVGISSTRGITLRVPIYRARSYVDFFQTPHFPAVAVIFRNITARCFASTWLLPATHIDFIYHHSPPPSPLPSPTPPFTRTLSPENEGSGRIGAPAFLFFLCY